MIYPQEETDRNFEVEFNAAYEETSKADDFLQSIVEKETIRLSLNGSYFFTDRYSIDGGVFYKDQNTITDGFNDIETYTLPFDFFYRYSDTLSFGIGYQYRDTTIDDATPPAADSTDHALYLTVKGQLTPNVEAMARVGGQRRNFDSSAFEDQDTFFLESELSWALSERSKLELTAGNEFDTSAENQSVETAYVELAYVHRFDEKLKIRASIGLEDSEFTRLEGDNFRDDEELITSIAAEYVLIEDRLTLDGLLYYADQDSNQADSDYDRTFIILGASIIY